MITIGPRDVPLGGTRAMHVRRTLPHRELVTVGAWCFLDDFGPQPAPGEEGVDRSGVAEMDVPPHPHTGLQTVTWLLDGEVRHQDSLGSDVLIRPGQLNLMTAGRGISHAETSRGDDHEAVRGLQLWVALPSRARDMVPDFAHHDDLPTTTGDGLTATVLLGALAGVTSPARCHSPIVGAELTLDRRTDASLALQRDFEHALLALDDGVTVDGVPLERSSLRYLPAGADEVRLRAERSARVMLIGGEPFGEELLMWWNFVARSHDEVVEAREEWMAAVGGASTRFGRVIGYDGGPLPAPALPNSRLKPRRRVAAVSD